MKKTFFSRAVCIAAVLVLCFSTALGANDSDNLVRLLNDTTVCLDPGLNEPYGVLSAGSVVYTGKSVFSSEAAALEIIFSHDRIIHTGYIPLMSGINTLTDAEAEEYAAKASEGILYRPGIILLDVSFATGDPFAVAETLPSGDESGDFSVESEAEPVLVQVIPDEAAYSADILPDDASRDYAVEPEGPIAGGAEIPGLVKLLDTAAVCIDPLLQRTLDVLPAGAVVYADAVDPASGSVTVIFCVDYIIRTGYVSGTAVGPLTDPEASEYAEKARDGIVYRPGVILLNTVTQNSTAPEQPDPSEIPPLPVAEAPARADANPTAAPNPPAANVPARESLFPENPENGSTYPLPLSKRYLLNPDEPIRGKTKVTSVTLPVYSPGHAEGIIDFGVTNKNGILVVVASFPFSEDVASDHLTIPVSFTHDRNSFVLVRFISTNTCEFSMTADRKSQLVYFNGKYDVFLTNSQVAEGYTILYTLK